MSFRIRQRRRENLNALHSGLSMAFKFSPRSFFESKKQGCIGLKRKKVSYEGQPAENAIQADPENICIN